MAKTFSDLSPEKRKQIHDAALQVFAENGYKRANTQEIAYKAGISKGLLFYYFKNKQSLCLHLLNWAIEQIEIQLKDDIHQSKDFFQRLESGTQKKLEFFEKMPFLLDFSLRMYYTTDKEIAPSIQNAIVKMTNILFDRYFSDIDTQKFKPGISPQMVLNQMIYLCDGYLHQQMLRHQPISMENILQQYNIWKAILKQYAYKEEYQ